MVSSAESESGDRPAVERLRQEARRYEALISAEGAIVWVVDPELRPTGRNQPWEQYTGQTPEQYAQLGWFGAVHPDDHALVRRRAQDAIRQSEPITMEVRLRRADGEYRRNVIRAIPILENGTIREWIGTASDVEDVRRATDEQRDLRARLLALTQGAETVLSTRDQGAARTGVVALAQRVLQGDAYAIWWLDVRSQRWRIVHASGLSEAFVSTTVEGEFVPFHEPVAVGDVGISKLLAHRLEVLKAEGIRSLLTIPLRIDGENRATIVVYYRTRHDVSDTELRVSTALGQMATAALWNAETYEALQHSKMAAERANQAKDEFLAILSHELRTPLNAIMGWLHMLRDGLSGEMTQHALEVIARNARTQKQLVEDLLDVARIAGGRLDLQRVPLDLCDVGRLAVDSALPSAKAKDITLTFDGPSQPVPVSGDANRLQQVMSNVLSNAIKFTDSGGRVTVRVEAADEYAELTVTDTGIGMSPEFLTAAFDRFRQADPSLTRAYGGLGLGLWVVKQVIEAHGGTAAAESVGKGHGTTIRMTLPTDRSIG